MSPHRRPSAFLTPLVLAALSAGCAGVIPSPEAPPPAPLPPAGYGTLRQDEVTVNLTSGDLRLKVTPLAESVTRTTAPDTYRRLSALADQVRSRAVQESGSAGPTLFLVSAFSESPDVAFVPEEVQLVSSGVRLRPAAIIPVTGGWEQRRLRQRQTEMAVYAFAGGVDLESDLVVVYGLEESSAWSLILPKVRAERARVRARAGGGGTTES
jgi:hypothetical protein